MRIAFLMFLAAFFTGCGSEPLVEIEAEPEPGPPSTDISLFEWSGSEVRFVTKISDRDGYDNQPSFSPDGAQVLFTSDRTGSTDTYSFTLDSGTVTQLTSTAEREYSPKTMRGDRSEYFSVVRQDTTGAQELWVYPLDSKSEPRQLIDTDSVAYYTWVGDDQILFWRLGNPRTLRLFNENTSIESVISPGAVFSLQRIPGERASSYLIEYEDDSSEIRKFNWETASTVHLAPTLGDGQDFAVAPDGRLLMMMGSELYTYRPGQTEGWELVADLGVQEGTRLAVSPDGKFLAVVGSR